MKSNINLLITFILAWSVNSLAQVEVEGDVDGNWTIQDSPYIVTGDITIRNDEELTIDPGVVVRFQEGHAFVVNGLLSAVGTVNSRIIFTAENEDELWHAISLENPADDCEISFCVFEFSEQTGRYNNVDSRGAALYGVECNNLIVSNNIFRNSIGSGQGVVCFYSSTGEFTDNHIHDNETYTEIAVFDGSPMLIARNLIENNVSEYGTGIFVLSDSPLIEDNIIRYNRSTIMEWGTGLYLVDGCRSIIRGNLIYGNEPGGVYIGVNCRIDQFENNVVYGNEGGSGIFIWQNCELTIRNSIIWNQGISIELASDDNDVDVEYSVIEDYRDLDIEVGEGMLEFDADFVDPDQDDYNLNIRSFCIDAGDPESPEDTDGSRADIGALAIDHDNLFPVLLMNIEEIFANESSENMIRFINDGEFPLWIRIEIDSEWIDIDPVNQVLNPDEELDIIVNIDADGLEFGRYESQFIIESSDQVTPFFEFPIVLELVEPDRELTLTLSANWNMISINIFLNPGRFHQDDEPGPDILTMFGEFENRNGDGDHNVILVKDVDGQFWSPEFNFIGIPFWDYTQGYLIKLREESEITWEGDIIPSQTDIPMHSGWNMIAYFPRYDLDASNESNFYVLSPIIDRVLLAKEGNGDFLSPEFGFSMMEPWTEGKGYQIKLNEDGEDNIIFNYPEEQDEGAYVGEVVEQGGHWTAPSIGESNMSVLITEFNGIKLGEGDQVAAFTSSGIQVGLGTITDGRSGLAIWADEEATDQTEGALDGEAFVLKLWDADMSVERDLDISIKMGNGLVYETNSFTAIEVTVQPIIPDVYSLSQNFPNPFNNRTKLSFGLPEDSDVSISVFNISGRLVTTLVNN